jgi:hypothetical protein
VRITARSTPAQVALEVSSALEAAGIVGVLTGGGCASIYTRGAYQSADLDFVLQSVATRKRLDSALGAIGFRREGDRYLHPAGRFFVEFPAGPLGIGNDLRISPRTLRIARKSLRLLSPTDSCRDRLAGFYHWQDRQSLRTAVQIALHQRVHMAKIRAWSLEEGAGAGFEEFRRELRRARRRD